MCYEHLLYTVPKPATKGELQLDLIRYWVNASHAFPHISPVACDILSVPPSLVPVERVLLYLSIFSPSVDICCGPARQQFSLKRGN